MGKFLFHFTIIEAEYGDTTWVAEGTFKPTNSSFRTFYFSLSNGVKWYGGFQGNETDLSQRDYETHETILSGDIAIQSDSTGNSYHVVYTVCSDITTELDGFLLVDGLTVDPNISVGSSRNYGVGLLISATLIDSIARPNIELYFFQK